MTAHPKTCPATGELHFFGYAMTARRSSPTTAPTPPANSW